jgi:hypothetical protein
MELHVSVVGVYHPVKRGVVSLKDILIEKLMLCMPIHSMEEYTTESEVMIPIIVMRVSGNQKGGKSRDCKNKEKESRDCRNKKKESRDCKSKEKESRDGKNKKIREQRLRQIAEQKKREQQRKEDEKRRLEQLKRMEKHREERRRRKEEMAKRKEEAQKEAERQERLRLEELERRKQERLVIAKRELKKQQDQREFKYRLAHSMTEEQQFHSWVWKKEKEKVQQVVQMQTYQPHLNITDTSEKSETVVDARNVYDEKGFF